MTYTWSCTLGAGASSLYKNNILILAVLVIYVAAMPGDRLLAATVDLDTH